MNPVSLWFLYLKKASILTRLLKELLVRIEQENLSRQRKERQPSAHCGATTMGEWIVMESWERAWRNGRESEGVHTLWRKVELGT